MSILTDFKDNADGLIQGFQAQFDRYVVKSDFERGEWDCLHNFEASSNESEEYYNGYSQAYAQLENQTHIDVKEGEQ